MQGAGFDEYYYWYWYWYWWEANDWCGIMPNPKVLSNGDQQSKYLEEEDTTLAKKGCSGGTRLGAVNCNIEVEVASIGSPSWIIILFNEILYFCKWLATFSRVSPGTFINSRTLLGTASATQAQNKYTAWKFIFITATTRCSSSPSPSGGNCVWRAGFICGYIVTYCQFQVGLRQCKISGEDGKTKRRVVFWKQKVRRYSTDLHLLRSPTVSSSGVWHVAFCRYSNSSSRRVAISSSTLAYEQALLSTHRHREWFLSSPYCCDHRRTSLKLKKG